MIDKDIIDSTDESLRLKLRQAFVLIANSGVIQLQKARFLARIIEGADNEDVNKVSQQVLDYRRNVHGLIAMQELGDAFDRESR